MSGYIGNIPTPQATQSRQSFTATASQTSFATVGYTAGFIDVYLNGVHLLDGTDYTATNGSDIVLTTGAALNDVVEFVAYSTYEVNSQNYTGGLTVDNDGATVLTVDRATSDGTIIDLQKDGVSKGTIGLNSNRPYLEKDAAGGITISSSGGNPIILPTSSAGALSDNLANIGAAAYRFKDLYLSGVSWIGGSTMPAGVAGIKLNIVGGSNDLMASYSTSTAAKTHWLFNNPNGTVGTIRTSASTTTYNTSSDYRLKENITPIQGAADIVKTMRPCTYTFKAGGDWADGFIAHELQELHPVAVSGEKDAMRDEEYEVTPAVLDEEGNVVTEAVMGTRSVPDYQGVDYSKLTPILTAALQEALNKIDALESQNAAFEARLTALEATP